MVIPGNWRDCRAFWERVPHFTVVTRRVRGRDLPFVVEPTGRDSVYTCTVDDIATICNAAPAEHMAGVQGVILRQPKRKEAILSSAWGRLGYAVRVGPISGAAIVVEACRLPLTLKWRTRLDPPQQQELDRLVREADRVESNGRHHILHFGLAAVRGVQLYRTVLHELGHWVDYYEKVDLSSRARNGSGWGALWDAYCRRPLREREAFAHCYARELAKNLKVRGVIPFDRILNLRRLAAEGLSPKDFVWDPEP
jgi:hypothetical protein